MLRAMASDEDCDLIMAEVVVSRAATVRERIFQVGAAPLKGDRTRNARFVTVRIHKPETTKANEL